MMTRVFGVALVLALAAGSGCYTTGTYASVGVSSGPPASYGGYYERDGYVWVQGRWLWDGAQWQWQEGYWIPARSGYVYAQGYWYYDGGWYWRDGYWLHARPGYVWIGGRWDAHRHVWIRGRFARRRPGYRYHNGRWIHRNGYRRGRPHGTWRRSPTGHIRDHRRIRSRPHRSGGGRVRDHRRHH